MVNQVGYSEKFILLAIIIGLLVLPGCNKQEASQVASATSGTELSRQKKLVFSVTESEKPGFTTVSEEALGDHSESTSIVYDELEEVFLQSEDGEITLPEAIRDGKLTIPEMFAFARMDAQNGFCKETYTSNRGLTHFVYAYPECTLDLVYDVYETPDGKQTLVSEICLCKIRDDESTIGDVFIDESSPWGYFLDREDWGITFQVTMCTPTKIVMDCSQSGGQQIGELLIESFQIFNAEEFDDPNTEKKLPLAGIDTDSDFMPVKLPRDGSSEISLDWDSTIGDLKPGNYYLRLNIVDSYEESDVHPLMQNFHDRQRYYIPFSVS